MFTTTSKNQLIVKAIFIDRGYSRENQQNLLLVTGQTWSYNVVLSASLHRLKSFWYVNLTTAESLPSENSNDPSPKKSYFLLKSVTGQAH